MKQSEAKRIAREAICQNFWAATKHLQKLNERGDLTDKEYVAVLSAFIGEIQRVTKFLDQEEYRWRTNL